MYDINYIIFFPRLFFCFFVRKYAYLLIFKILNPSPLKNKKSLGDEISKSNLYTAKFSYIEILNRSDLKKIKI